MSKEDIALRLRQARLAAHKTQKEAADAIGMTYQAISSYERGLTNVESGILVRLCQFYGVSVPEILGEPPATESSTFELSDVEKQLVLDFRKLNAVGKQYVLQSMLLALNYYCVQKETPLTIAARGGNVVQPEHAVDKTAFYEALSEAKKTDNL